jgi:hypothetical protein
MAMPSAAPCQDDRWPTPHQSGARAFPVVNVRACNGPKMTLLPQSIGVDFFSAATQVGRANAGRCLARVVEG